MPDGSRGYPCGFQRDEVSLEGRILAVVDAYDVIASDRRYRKARPHQCTLEEIRRDAGGRIGCCSRLS